VNRWARRSGGWDSASDGLDPDVASDGPNAGSVPVRAPGTAAISGPVAGTATATVTAPRPIRTSPESVTSRRGPRRVRLGVRRIDPWSVLKFTFIFSLALLVVLVVAVAVLYLVLDSMGVFTSIDSTLRDLTSSNSTSITSIFSFRRIVGGAAVLGAVNVVLITALATLGAFLYNVCSDIVGGIEVTLTERE